MRVRPGRALGACGLLIGLLLCAPARAADPAPPPDPAAEEIRDESLAHEVTEWDAPPPPQHGLGAWSLGWRKGLVLERYDGAVRLHFGGRVLLDAAAFHLDDGLRGITGQSGWNSSSEVRQGRVYAQGTFLRRFFAKAVYDWNQSEFLDVYFGMRGLGPLGTLQVGYMRAPFSLEARTSRLSLTFMERSLANALVPNRDSGAVFSNTLLDGRLRWAAGAMVASDGFGGVDDDLFDGTDETWSANVRINGLPVWSEDGKHMVLVGFSYAHRFGIDQDVSLSVRPESHLTPALLDTGTITGGRSADLAGLEAVWQTGPFSLQAELTGSWLERRGSPNLFFWGGYLNASWFLTGEHRVYGQRSGTFGRVVPKQDFAPWKGRWGAFQLAARLSWLDLDDRDVSGGRQLDLTLGLNWHLDTGVRLMMNYVHAHVRGADDADIAQMRIQLEY